MVGHRLFAWIDKHLKIGTGREDRVFGGMNVIIVGDFAQLTPVGDASLFIKPYFDGRAWRVYEPGHVLYVESFKKIVMLSNEHNQRQAGSDRGSKVFRCFLQNVRNGTCTRVDYNLIRTRMRSVVSKAELATFRNASRIFAKRKPAALWNLDALKKLEKPIIRIEAKHNKNCKSARQGTFRDYGVDSTLYLAEGAFVALTVNLCTERGLTNGATGKVIAIIYKDCIDPPALPSCIVVQFDHLNFPEFPGSVAITPYSARWKSFTRTQFSLILAWAITIHKSQGMTLAKVVIDTCQATFAVGILYTALTRVRSLHDIIIDDFEES